MESFHREWLWFDGFLRQCFFFVLKWSLHAAVLLGGIYFFVWFMAKDSIYHDIKDVPVRYAAVVMGCVKKVGKYENKFFNTRIDAAKKLYDEGKVQYLIVSGDNSHDGYDEPTDMKAALVAKGVPANRIYCDYAGFRTLDSVVRARKIFGQPDFIIVSQHFHNERALYLAHRFGMGDVVAFDAADAEAGWMLKMYGRELLARAGAILDVEILGTKPKFLGTKIVMSEKTPPVDAQPIK
jgi:SanA protein